MWPTAWIFRVSLSGAAEPVNTAVMQVVALLLAGVVLMPAIALWAVQGRPWGGIGMLEAVVGTFSWIHIELVFRRWRHIPFTRPFEPFRQSLPVLCLPQVIAFAVVVWSGWQLYPRFLSRPAYLCIPLFVAVGLRLQARRPAKDPFWGDSIDDGLTFELAPGQAVQTLGLR